MIQLFFLHSSSQYSSVQLLIRGKLEERCVFSVAFLDIQDILQMVIAAQHYHVPEV